MKSHSRKAIVPSLAISLAIAAPSLLADPAISLTGGRLNITVPSANVGARLLLVWDDADKGDDPANWANSHEIVAAVPAADTQYAVDLAYLGITNGQPCRLVVYDQYRQLDMLKMTSKQTYIDTGIPDSDCYAVRFGFYGNECAPDNSGKYANFIGTYENNGGFTLGENDANMGSWYWAYQGTKLTPRPNVRTDAINDVAFANQTFTLNGNTVNSSLPAGPVGTSGETMRIGAWVPMYRFLFGWWSYVRFDDAQGDAILDYIPVQRYGDDTVGFYDRATGKLVTSSGTGAFTPGTVTNQLFSVLSSQRAFAPTGLVELALRGSRLRVSVPASFADASLLVVWDAADRGDDPDAWAHSSQVAAIIPAVGGDYTVNLSHLGVADRQVCGVVVAHRLRRLDMLKMTTKQTYIDTGILDSDVYGVRFGFYGSECAPDNGGKAANFIGSYDGTGCFTLGMNDTDFGSWYWDYRGERDYKLGGMRPSVSTSAINNVAFTNQVFTLNGSVVKRGLPEGPVGFSGYTMHIGTWAVKYRFLYGWWSYVRFDDADGNAILDYIPAQRIADDAVGFYDRATGGFVTSSGNGAFTAGTVTDASFDVVLSRQTFVKVDEATCLYIR